MYRIILFISFSLLTVLSFAQINFEKGYFIDNEGKKTECFIKNKEWQKSPTEFEYKTSINNESSRITIDDVKEFSVYNYSKYIRFTVQIDSSSNSPGEYSNIEAPIWNTKTLFLKVLIEGKASLFLYDDLFNKKFFFKTDSSLIEQLVFKKYSQDEVHVKANRYYKQQLWNKLRNENYSIKQIEAIQYEKKEIEEYFIKYNNLTNSIKYINKQKNKWYLNPILGLGFSKSSLFDYNTVIKEYKATQKSNYLYGFQVEYFLPVNKNKWSLLLEYTIQESKHETNNGVENLSATYKSTNLTFGGKYTSYITNNLSLFISGMYSFKGGNGSDLIMNNYHSGYNANNPFSVGLGINFSKLSIEYRMSDAKENLFNRVTWNMEKANQSFIILSYKLFDLTKK